MKKIIHITYLFFLLIGGLKAQNKVFSYGMQFLNIPTDARHTGMGEAGGATSADVTAIYYNPAKLGLSESVIGFHAAYIPWLRSLTNDMSISNVSVYGKLKPDSKNTFGLFRTFFNHGSIEFRTPTGSTAGSYNSRERVLGLHFSRKINDNLSLGINVKYGTSNILGDYVVNGQATKVANVFLADIGIFKMLNVSNDLKLNVGASISNIGGKINYGINSFNSPTNIRLALSPTIQKDRHTFTLGFDATRFLISGASGINFNFGGEYWYNRWVAGRIGYVYDAPVSGRRYLTFGVGGRIMKQFGVDFSLMSNSGLPLSNTKRFSLIADLVNTGKEKGKNKNHE